MCVAHGTWYAGVLLTCGVSDPCTDGDDERLAGRTRGARRHGREARGASAAARGARARRRARAASAFPAPPAALCSRPWQVTLQELSNLERFVKRNEAIANAGAHPPAAERLLKEEAYLKSRLVFVQQELATAGAAADASPGGGRLSGRAPPDAAPSPARRGAAPQAAASTTAEESVLDSALSI